MASSPVAMLWPPPVSGDCLVPTPPPVFMAVNIAAVAVGSGESINYNGHSANDPADYFLAPSTEGEPNVMPGDIDGDLDMDADDYAGFVACLGQSGGSPPCSRADLDGSMTVDCADWPLFASDWAKYSSLSEPPVPSACLMCLHGDVNNDGTINGEDIGAFMGVAVGDDMDPVHRCAADVDANGIMNCEDVVGFVRLALGAAPDCLAGDINLDGLVDGGDIQPLVDMLLNPGCRTNVEICPADVNGDSTISPADVAGFVDLLLSQGS
ncbi:MAG: hypothetical protein HZA51_07235 [Planctomycetes bacterium]|nr:hypothetical protein [Planctomycetota bacterium]